MAMYYGCGLCHKLVDPTDATVVCPSCASKRVELLTTAPNSASDAIVVLRDIVAAADHGSLCPDSIAVRCAREVLQQAHVA
jgi:hypothetical protein